MLQPIKKETDGMEKERKEWHRVAGDKKVETEAMAITSTERNERP